MDTYSYFTDLCSDILREKLRDFCPEIIIFGISYIKTYVQQIKDKRGKLHAAKKKEIKSILKSLIF